jgi:hypothetical protein
VIVKGEECRSEEIPRYETWLGRSLIVAVLASAGRTFVKPCTMLPLVPHAGSSSHKLLSLFGLARVIWEGGERPEAWIASETFICRGRELDKRAPRLRLD